MCGRAKPYDDLFSASVDASHLSDLVTSLNDVALVDTDSVDPHDFAYMVVSEISPSSEQVFRDTEGLAVGDDGGRDIDAAPGI